MKEVLNIVGNYNSTMALVDVVDGKYNALEEMVTCRAYMAEYLFKLKFFNGRNVPHNYKNYNYKKGNMYLAVNVTNPYIFKAKLSWLHSKEAQAKVKKTKVFETQEKSVYLLEASKYWKDSAWKMLLYTYYIREMQGGGWIDYTEVIEKKANDTQTNEDRLLFNLKKQNEFADPAIFIQQGSWDSRFGTHDKEGFVSICTGKNPKMAKLLGVNDK